jgi:hypothetical protein
MRTKVWFVNCSTGTVAVRVVLEASAPKGAPPGKFFAVRVNTAVGVPVGLPECDVGDQLAGEHELIALTNVHGTRLNIAFKADGGLVSPSLMPNSW